MPANSLITIKTYRQLKILQTDTTVS